MKPLRLKVTAFGPYAATQVFDFRQLQDRNLFLITGKTGAGKTSMFDAMCMALYGESSGGGRKDYDMRSHHAEQKQLTEIVFEFAVGKTIYRSRYIPSQERPTKRGEGTTEQKTEAALYQIASLEQPDEQAQLLSATVKKTKTAIQTILGCGYPQFRQIIMLAQGQFRQLLEADSKDRESIFQTLFETQLYQKIEEGLKAQALDIEKDYQNLENQLKGILRSGDFASEEAIEQKIQSLQAEVGGKEKAAEEANQRLEAIQQRLEAEKIVHQKLTEQQTSRESLKILEEQLPQHEQKQSRLQQARKAAVVASHLENLTERQQSQAEQVSLKATLESQQTSVEAAFKEAQNQKNRVDQEEPQRLTLYNQLQHLESLVPQVNAWQKAQQALTHAKNQVDALEHSLLQISQDAQSFQQALEEFPPKLEALRQSQGKLAAVQWALKEAQNQLTAKKDMEAIQTRLEKLSTEEAHAQSAYAQKKRDTEQEKQTLKTMRQQQTQAQAAYWATLLEEGKSCPVCGALEHPQPASQEEVPSQADMESMEERIQQSEQATEDFHQQMASLQEKKAKEGGRYATRQEQLQENHKQPVSFFLSNVQAVQEEMEELQWVEQKLQALQSEEKALQMQREAKQKEAESHQKSLQEAQGEIAKQTGRLEQLETQIEPAYREPSTLEKCVADLQQKYETATCLKEKAEADFQQASEEKMRIATQLQSNAESLQQAQFSLESAQEKFQQHLESSGFLTVEVFEKEHLPEPVLENLDKEVRAFEAQHSAAQQRYSRAVEEAKGLEKKDMLPMEEEKHEQEAQKERILEELGKLKEQLAHHQDVQKQIQKVQSQIKKHREAFEEVGRISRVANGQNQHGITLQRFILASLLDDVLLVASQRLLKMTQSRYFLHRAENRQDKRKAFGLDLMLTDQYTGREREVRTLSGGEGFLASLALALGLSEVVQGRAGGIQLDTLFIDEGFGTLSADALDEVMNVLNQLSGHHRLVGIISHVPELKERIEARLEVTATQKGSTARFVV